MPKLLPLPNPEDWRIDETGHVLVHRIQIGKEALYTLYEVRRVTWTTTVKECLAAITRWLCARGDDPPAAA